MKILSDYNRLMALAEKYKKLAHLEERKGDVRAAMEYWESRRSARTEADMLYMQFLSKRSA